MPVVRKVITDNLISPTAPAHSTNRPPSPPRPLLHPLLLPPSLSSSPNPTSSTRSIGTTSTFCLSLCLFVSSLSVSLCAHSSPHRAGSIKSSRRSSYLLAITAERSKSCDEGLNTFREEGRVLSWVPSSCSSWLFVELKKLHLLEDEQEDMLTVNTVGVVVIHRRLPKRVKSFFTDGVSFSPLINTFII